MDKTSAVDKPPLAVSRGSRAACGLARLAAYGGVMALAWWSPAEGRASGTSTAPRPVRVGAMTYITLHDMARFYGMQLSESTGTRSLVLSSRWSRIEFEHNSRKLLLNGVRVWLHAPVTRVRRRWAVEEADFYGVIDPVLRRNHHLARSSAGLVVLDPGHGGRDEGARGAGGLLEKNVVLDIAHRVRDHLARDGIRVRLTRTGDQYLGLQERAELAARWGADVFVSIHCNAAAAPAVHGVETFILAVPGYPTTRDPGGPRPAPVASRGNRYDAPNMVLGWILQQKMVQSLAAEDRGLRRARFLVLKEAPCAAALVECGFLSHPPTEALLGQADHRDRIARAVAEGIREYLQCVLQAAAATR